MGDSNKHVDQAGTPNSLGDFAQSRPLTLGVELELQIVNTHHYDLTPAAADLLRVLNQEGLPGEVKPEMTSSMVEISTGICEGYDDAVIQLRQLRDALSAAAARLNIGLSGGGTHPFQHWSERKIYPAQRFHQLSEMYGYLSKQFTVFGQHVHVGCSSPDEALWLLHAMSPYIPHLIALSASSPFVQGIDTGFNSARLNSVFAFPLSGRAPFALTWTEFREFFDKMTQTGVVESMKDFYWDIRPKPEFGTIEVRVMDTPLTLEKAAAIAAYIQTLARWLTQERPVEPAEDDYLVYTFNRFQACRFGFDGIFVDPKSGRHTTIREHILATIERIDRHAEKLDTRQALNELATDARERGSDASWIRDQFEKEHLLEEVVRRQTLRWKG
ncbi:MAG: YbdK family carboxylate-amine ligase [Quisquiliibacterium sp.]